MPGSPEVIANMYEWAKMKKAGLEGMGRVAAANMQSDARQNAPWQDRTGNARQGLNGGIYYENENLFIYIAHSMEYGVFLELCNDGKYAILEKTRDRHKAIVHEQAKRIITLVDVRK